MPKEKKEYPDAWIRIQRIIDEVFEGNEKQFAKKINFQYTNLHRSQQTKALPFSLLEKMHDSLGIPIQWVRYGEGPDPILLIHK